MYCHKPRKLIVVLVSWYPTKENQIQGHFFRERSRLLERHNDVIILYFRKSSLKNLLNREYTKVKPLLDPQVMVIPKLLISKESVLFLLLPHVIYRKLKVIDKTVTNYFLNRILSRKLKRKPDVIYAMSAQSCASETLYMSRKYSVPFIISEHSQIDRTALRNKDVAQALNKCSLFIGISSDKIQEVLKLGINVNTEFVGNCVNTDRFFLKTDSVNKKFTLLFSGYYCFRKDFETFISALKILTSRGVDYQAIFVGAGGMDQGITKSKIIPRDISNNVLWISHALPSEMVNYYHQADLTVLTSISEGMPNTVLESLACGTPVISTKCGGSQDIITPENGRLVEIRDYKKLAHHIIEIYSGQLNFDSVKVRNSILRKYSHDSYRIKMQRIMDNLDEMI